MLSPYRYYAILRDANSQSKRPLDGDVGLVGLEDDAPIARVHFIERNRTGKEWIIVSEFFSTSYSPSNGSGNKLSGVDWGSLTNHDDRC